jgi:hypothetical protein
MTKKEWLQNDMTAKLKRGHVTDCRESVVPAEKGFLGKYIFLPSTKRTREGN